MTIGGMVSIGGWANTKCFKAFQHRVGLRIDEKRLGNSHCESWRMQTHYIVFETSMIESISNIYYNLQGKFLVILNLILQHVNIFSPSRWTFPELPISLHMQTHIRIILATAIHVVRRYSSFIKSYKRKVAFGRLTV